MRTTFTWWIVVVVIGRSIITCLHWVHICASVPCLGNGWYILCVDIGCYCLVLFDNVLTCDRRRLSQLDVLASQRCPHVFVYPRASYVWLSPERGPRRCGRQMAPSGNETIWRATRSTCQATVSATGSIAPMSWPLKYIHNIILNTV